MAIDKMEVYVAECDECHILLDSAGYGGYTVYSDTGEAKDQAVDGEWFVGDGLCLCESCKLLKKYKGVVCDND